MTRRLCIIVLAFGAASLGACATVKGVGKDIQSVGQAGEDVIKGK